MKKLVTIALLAAMLLTCFAGCAMQKGEIYIADAANVQEVAVTAPTTVPTDASKISKWNGTTAIPNGGTKPATINFDISIDAEDPSKNTIGIDGADITWFNPNVKEQQLNDADDFVGFLALRLFAADTAFMATYKEITDKDLNYFAEHVFILNTNVDLNGIDIKNYNSAIMFGGTFDGGDNAIFNYKMTGINSGTKGFFSKLTGNACLKNFSLLEGTCVVGGQKDSNEKKNGKYQIKDGAKGPYGIVVGQADAPADSEIVINNVYTDCEVTCDASNVAKDVFHTVGGIVGQVSGKGTVKIDNCASASTFKLEGNGTTYGKCDASTGNLSEKSTSKYGQYTGGIVARVTGNVTAIISNCSFSGEISSTNNYVAGILANNTSTKAVKIENCVNSGSITSTKTHVAGILASSSGTGAITVTGCTNSGDISTKGAADKVSGIVGEVTKTSKLTINNCTSTAEAEIWGKTQVAGILSLCNTLAEVEIKGCTVASTVKAGKEKTPGNISSGMIAYIVDSTKVVVEDCTFGGIFSGDRATGGVIGYFDNDYTVVTEGQSFLVKNCDVTADGVLNIEITNSNPSTGGIIGRVRGASMIMENCDFAGKLNVTFSTTDSALTQKMAAGGLIGILFDDNGAQSPVATGSVTNCTVTGTLRFLDNTDALCTGAIFVGGTANYTADTTNITYSGLTCAGVTVDTSAVKEGEKGTPMQALQNGNGPTVVGFQLRDAYAPEGSEEGAAKTLYDIRYVAVLNDIDTAKAAGFKVTLIYKDAEGNKVVKVQDQIVYAKNVYETIKGEKVSYTAASFQGDYLVTLVIEGVDVNYTTKAGTLEVLLTPFTATDADNINYGMTADHGKIVVAEPAA